MNKFCIPDVIASTDSDINLSAILSRPRQKRYMFTQNNQNTRVIFSGVFKTCVEGVGAIHTAARTAANAAREACKANIDPSDVSCLAALVASMKVVDASWLTGVI